MTANGLIVAFVVVVWATYFVPLVLRRYDEANKSASLESLSSLSRVIHWRRRNTDSVPAPTSQTANPSQTADPEPVYISDPEPVEGSQQTRTTRSARVAARRRRRTLVSLVAVWLLVTAAIGFSLIPLVWVAAPSALIVAWLVACRIQVRGERGLSRSRRTDQSAERPRVVDIADEETVIVSGQFEEVDPARVHVMEDAPLAADALDEQIVIAVPSITPSGEALWDPLPVTVPTYVTKPRVGRTVRTIDFSTAGSWTSGHVEGEDTELPGAETIEKSNDQRRASGE